ncbi:ATP binding protein [Sphingopyxis sp. FD7]|nr:ATP binding protein [Sphingopyxis sp. FD7]
MIPEPFMGIEHLIGREAVNELKEDDRRPLGTEDAIKFQQLKCMADYVCLGGLRRDVGRRQEQVRIERTFDADVRKPCAGVLSGHGRLPATDFRASRDGSKANAQPAARRRAVIACPLLRR